MEELDYKDLFRDAVLMMAEFARAAGFDPRDEGVEPPDVVARIENLHAEIEEMRLTLAAERGDPAGAPSPGWEYGIIDEEGGLGWRKPTADGMLFAWGAGIDFLGADHAPDPHPGGWTRWLADEDGDLDEMLECVNDETWTARAAMIAADDAFAKIERLAQTSQYPSPAQAVRPG